MHLTRNRLAALLFLVGLLVLSLPAESQTEPTLTFTPKVTVGVESAVPEFQWSTTPAAASCTATGASDWTGSKPFEGSATLAPISQSQSYSLECQWVVDTAARLSWEAPTTNTDGSPLTNLASYRIYRGDTAEAPLSLTAQSRAVSPPLALSQTWTGLTQGTHYFCVRAFNTDGTESACSNVASKVVAARTITRSVTITVNPRPSAPTNFVVE